MGVSNYLTPQEAADILKVKKTTVYDMIRKNKLKATRLGKHLRIQESDVRRLIGDDTEMKVHSVSRYAKTDILVDSVLSEAAPSSGIVICGQDVLLDLLSSYVNTEIGSAAVMRSYLGSYNGLYALYQGQVNIATSHLWDRKTDAYNLPFIERLLPGETVQVYHIANRPVGIYTAKGNPKSIFSIQDFARPDVTMVNREKGSGIRVLTDSLFLQHNINTANIAGYHRAVNSHLAAVSVIARGGADCAFGNHHAAMNHPLIDFSFVKNESYDMVIPLRETANPTVQKVIEVLQSELFQQEVSALGQYDPADMGKRIL